MRRLRRSRGGALALLITMSAIFPLAIRTLAYDSGGSSGTVSYTDPDTGDSLSYNTASGYGTVVSYESPDSPAQTTTTLTDTITDTFDNSTTGAYLSLVFDPTTTLVTQYDEFGNELDSFYASEDGGTYSYSAANAGGSSLSGEFTPAADGGSGKTTTTYDEDTGVTTVTTITTTIINTKAGKMIRLKVVIWYYFDDGIFIGPIIIPPGS